MAARRKGATGVSPGTVGGGEGVDGSSSGAGSGAERVSAKPKRTRRATGAARKRKGSGDLAGTGGGGRVATVPSPGVELAAGDPHVWMPWRADLERGAHLLEEAWVNAGGIASSPWWRGWLRGYGSRRVEGWRMGRRGGKLAGFVDVASAGAVG